MKNDKIQELQKFHAYLYMFVFPDIIEEIECLKVTQKAYKIKWKKDGTIKWYLKETFDHTKIIEEII